MSGWSIAPKPEPMSWPLSLSRSFYLLCLAKGYFQPFPLTVGIWNLLISLLSCSFALFHLISTLLSYIDRVRYIKECFVTILKVLQIKRHNFVNESHLLIWGKLQLGLIRYNGTRTIYIWWAATKRWSKYTTHHLNGRFPNETILWT